MTKKTNTIYYLASLAMLTALSLVLGYFLKIPSPTGMFTLLDVGIYFTAFYFGAKEGAVVGGVTGFLIDWISGYPQWMLHSLLWHGGQGFFAGFKGKQRPLGLFLASLVMVAGYFLSSLVLYNVADALVSLPTNLIQNGVGMAVGYVLAQAVSRRMREK